MIVESNAYLGIYSSTRTAAEITRVLSITPTESYEVGDDWGMPRENADGDLEQRKREHSGWRYDAPESGDSFTCLQSLVTLFAHKIDQLSELRSDCTMKIEYWGYSDSEQGGFLVPAEVLAGVAALGCDLHGTVHLSSAEEE